MSSNTPLIHKIANKIFEFHTDAVLFLTKNRKERKQKHIAIIYLSKKNHTYSQYRSVACKQQ